LIDEDEETDSFAGACLSPSARTIGAMHPFSAPCSPACCWMMQTRGAHDLLASPFVTQTQCNPTDDEPPLLVVDEEDDAEHDDEQETLHSAGASRPPMHSLLDIPPPPSLPVQMIFTLQHLTRRPPTEDRCKRPATSSPATSAGAAGAAAAGAFRDGVLVVWVL
jgi:hypothetical protein